MRWQNSRCKRIGSLGIRATPLTDQVQSVTKTGTNVATVPASGGLHTEFGNFNSIDNLTKQASDAGTFPGQSAYDNNRYGRTIGARWLRTQWFIFGA